MPFPIAEPKTIFKRLILDTIDLRIRTIASLTLCVTNFCTLIEPVEPEEKVEEVTATADVLPAVAVAITAEGAAIMFGEAILTFDLLVLLDWN